MALGLLADSVVGDPRRGHPVAAFGRLSAAAERVMYRDSRAVGAAYAGALVGAACLVGAAAERASRTSAAEVVVTAAATWAVVGGTTLRREARTMSDLLSAEDIAGARRRLAHLCGRDATSMDAADLARGTVESVAENTSDAVIGPLLWGAVAGVPGLLGYRAVNTLDAMVGHRSPRYERFGWAAARADDIANLVPSRVSAAAASLLAPLVQGTPSAAARVWRRDGGRHPSPNAGQVEAAFAGALGRTFGGPLVYGGRTADLPLLGNGPAPDVADIARAARLSAAVTVAVGIVAVGLRAVLDGRRR
jgi:adenosylcobinamide-phosphate synthase